MSIYQKQNISLFLIAKQQGLPQKNLFIEQNQLQGSLRQCQSSNQTMTMSLNNSQTKNIRCYMAYTPIQLQSSINIQKNQFNFKERNYGNFYGGQNSQKVSFKRSIKSDIQMFQSGQINFSMIPQLRNANQQNFGQKTNLLAQKNVPNNEQQFIIEGESLIKAIKNNQEKASSLYTKIISEIDAQIFDYLSSQPKQINDLINKEFDKIESNINLPFLVELKRYIPKKDQNLIKQYIQENKSQWRNQIYNQMINIYSTSNKNLVKYFYTFYKDILEDQMEQDQFVQNIFNSLKVQQILSNSKNEIKVSIQRENARNSEIVQKASYKFILQKIEAYGKILNKKDVKKTYNILNIPNVKVDDQFLITQEEKTNKFDERKIILYILVPFYAFYFFKTFDIFPQVDNLVQIVQSSSQNEARDSKQKLSSEMDDLFQTTPSIDGEMLKTWKKLGPLSVQKIQQESGQILIIDQNPFLSYTEVEKQEFGGYYQGLYDKLKKMEAGVGRDTYGFKLYEGQMDNGYPNGWGRAIYRDGSYYIGRFHYSRTNEGKMYDKDGNQIYEKTYKVYD